MINMQIILSIFAAATFPTVTTILGVILNRQDSKELRGEMSEVRGRLAKLATRVGRMETKIV